MSRANGQVESTGIDKLLMGEPLDAGEQSAVLASLGAASAADLSGAVLTGLDPAKYQGQVTALGAAIPAAGTAGRWYYVTVTGTLTDPDAAVAVTANGYLIDNGSAWLFRSGGVATLVVGAAADTVNRALIAQRNRFDRTRLNANSLVRLSNGTLETISNYYATDYIPVTPGGTVISNRAFYSDGSRGTAFYDSNKTFISSITTFAANTPVSVPAGAHWMRATINAGSALAAWYVGDGSSIPATVPAFAFADEQLLHNRVIQGVRRIMPIANIYDRLNVLTGSIITTSGTVSANASFVVTNYMPVVPGEQIIFSEAPGGGSDYGIVYYDLSLGRIPENQAGTLAGNTPYTVPQLAAYARMTVANNVAERLGVYVGSSLPAFFSNFGPPGAVNKRWKGKGLGYIGDSITDVDGWKEVATRFLEGAMILDSGTSGSSMGYKIGSANRGSMTGVDLAIVALGTNDWGFNRVLGSFGDAASPSTTYGNYAGPGTFYGDVRGLIEAILTEKPTVRLGFTTPLPRTLLEEGGSGSGITAVNGNGNTLRQFADAIRQVCESYAIPVLDLNRVSGWNTYNIGSYTSDGLHPNRAGYNSYSPMVARWMEGL